MTAKKTWMITVLLIVLTAWLSRALTHVEKTPIRKPLSTLPQTLMLSENPISTTWTSFDLELETEVLAKLGVDDKIYRVYRSAKDTPIWFYVGYFESQREGEQIHSPRHCYPGSGWVSESQGVVSLKTPQGPVAINQLFLAKGLDRQVVLYWYQSHGRVIASEYLGKFYLAWDAITQNRTDGALVRISAPIQNKQDPMIATTMRFAEQIFPSLSESLGSVTE